MTSSAIPMDASTALPTARSGSISSLDSTTSANSAEGGPGLMSVLEMGEALPSSRSPVDEYKQSLAHYTRAKFAAFKEEIARREKLDGVPLSPSAESGQKRLTPKSSVRKRSAQALY